jgi:hypothetical protein
MEMDEAYYQVPGETVYRCTTCGGILKYQIGIVYVHTKDECITALHARIEEPTIPAEIRETLLHTISESLDYHEDDDTSDVLVKLYTALDWLQTAYKEAQG